MPRVKGVYHNGVITPVRKIKLADNGEVEIVYGKDLKGTSTGAKQKLPIVKARELRHLLGFLSLGGDSVKDAERYDE